MSTIQFGRDERERDPLLRQVAALPQEIEPTHDLWPEIRARLQQAPPQQAPAPRGLSWSWALAAGAAVASVSVLFTWMVVKTPAGGPPQMASTSTTTTPLQPVSYGGYASLGPDYVQTRSQMLGLFNARLAELPAETRSRVEADLATIRKAAADIDAALATDPSSKLLNKLLLSTYQEEMRLYTTVADPGEAGRQRT
jgi:hypothetical protein